ncbi:type IIL restriction-modification enzyme MmeI [Prevotella sp. S7-1-8]|uniref:type IIL restriction-modification enzyme MmeI n=1 Tax=Prevotella sp. S7-1-8 TaxID=1284775 RepID=UPI0012E07D37|nr:type IIL restriction-modification enzyme MmeI [Prevotella sp. S7-1-8]
MQIRSFPVAFCPVFFMPRELLQAHQDNDRAVMRLYGFGLKMTETECVAELSRLYERMV